MTDVHCHVSGGDPSVRELLIGRDFVGVHPWETLGGSEGLGGSGGLGEALAKPLPSGEAGTPPLRRCGVSPHHDGGFASSSGGLEERFATIDAKLSACPDLGVGEIGLDRLKERTISVVMRETFERQLDLAARYARPVVLHGAKCWGEVVRACRARAKAIPAFLFHGFSRSDGLIPEIVELNGYVSVGPAILNDHAVNYRHLVRKIPADRLLVETDRTRENAATCPSVTAVAAKLAEVRGCPLSELETLVDGNLVRFLSRKED